MIGIAHIIVYLFTDSRTGLLMSACFLGLTVSLRYIKILQNIKITYILGICVIVATVLFSVLMAKYSVLNPFLEKMDVILSHRILNLYYGTVNHEGMLNTWSLWSVARNDYFFDLGIVRFFYWYGIIPGTIYFLAQCRLIWCGYKQKDYMLLAVMVVITVYSVFEAHFISDYMGRNYILFFFGMYLASMLGCKQEAEYQ